MPIPAFVITCVTFFLVLLIFFMWLAKRLYRNFHTPRLSPSANTSILDDVPGGRSGWRRWFGRGRHPYLQGGGQGQGHRLENREPTPHTPSRARNEQEQRDHELAVRPSHQLRHENRQVSGASTLPLDDEAVATHLKNAEKALAGLRNIRLETIRATSSPIPASTKESEHLSELILVPKFESSVTGINNLTKPNPLSTTLRLLSSP
ncbi:uncharacterized protein PAC_05568 [Phialocephala subalpina]|uniref:Uncharacterized protein n=1 Tax=Phialocephala subalpina TaxID=576137 RepID=A0A1L7WSC9_9HELO|nr:uncharacterized protein PAC_05568 [Phialocephala subalpina]